MTQNIQNVHLKHQHKYCAEYLEHLCDLRHLNVFGSGVSLGHLHC